MQLCGTRPRACTVLSWPARFQTGPARFLSCLYQLTRFQAGRPVYYPADRFINGPAVNNRAITYTVYVNTVVTQIVDAATINFSPAQLRLLIEGSCYLRVALIYLHTLYSQLLLKGGYYSGCNYYLNKYKPLASRLSVSLEPILIPLIGASAVSPDYSVEGLYYHHHRMYIMLYIYDYVQHHIPSWNSRWMVCTVYYCSANGVYTVALPHVDRSTLATSKTK